MHPLWRPRARAYLTDSLVHLAAPAALVPVGLVLRHRTRRPDERLLYALSALPPVAASLLASAQDSHRGTWGHRSQGLVVHTADGLVPSFGRALLRNSVKTGMPWQLGHLTALGAATGRLDRSHPWTLAAAVLVYSWLVVTPLTAALGSGRTVHDRVARTEVHRRHP